MDCFQYPLDTETLLRKKRRLRRELLAQNPHPLHKKIAILGGCSTASRRNCTKVNTPNTGRTPCSARRSWTSSTRILSRSTQAGAT